MLRGNASGNPDSKVLAGMDGCPGGWICVVRHLTTDHLQAHILSDISEIAALAPKPDIVMIDIPIGLAQSGPRLCDLEARRVLGRPRSSSVFPAPIRPCLAAASYEDACAIRMRIEGKKMSRQAWAILRKVDQVDRFLSLNRDWQTRIREVHPELSFHCWNFGTSMAHRKKSAEGFAERERLVRANFGKTCLQLGDTLPAGQFGRDDLMDAFAALWTAERVIRGTALIVPANPPADDFGLRMEILA
jgi:predicted RNase H-like nuclease